MVEKKQSSYMLLKDIIKKLRTKGAIAPSSRFLVNKMLSKIDYTQDLDILQLGFGNGVFTKEIIRRSTTNSSLTIFEVDKNCRKYKLDNKRITYVEDSAEKISLYFEDKKFDHIISTLPFASLQREVSQNIFKEIKQHLKKNGKFLQFQYSLFSRKDFNKLCKEKPKIDFELLNLPPAFIYEKTKYCDMG